ncbi:protein-disulfide reductase DsbD [Achromobacter sp.]|uniref:protein-disulfide reductase DsbD n=1 Tax=Achromobacter sp. TaxID=134375 RepID=UPI003C779043
MFVYRRVLAIVFLCLLAIGSAWASTGLFSWKEEAEFLDPVDVFKLAQVQRQGRELTAQGRIADSYYVYRHSLKLVSGQGEEVRLDLPPGTPKNDEFFGNTEIYLGDALRLRFPASVTGPLTLHWQGCAEGGICYPPQTMAVNLPVTAAEASAAADAPAVPPPASALPREAGASGGANVAEDQAAAQRLATLGPIAGTLLFFGFGLLLAFTPCTLPMIPIISSMVVGNQAKPRRAFITSLFYVLAMAGTYAAVGVAAGLAGANLQATLQSPWLLGAFAALFLILASSLFGLFELRLPSVLLNRLGSANQGRSGGNVVGAAALGFLSALLVGPCMTAPLAGALLYISQTGSALYGGLALFSLGLGMGLPLLAIAVCGARILPKPGAWMNSVRVAFGYVMVGMAVMMLDRFLPATVSLMLSGAWILSIAIGLLAWAQALAQRLRLMWALRTLGAIAGLWSIFMLVGAASGGESASQPLAHLRAASSAAASATAKPAYVQAKSVDDVDKRLAQAAAQGQWTLIDFYADWCISCHVIERNVFGDPAVAQRLARMQVLRPDVTRNDATDQALLKHWGVMGPPTLILVGPDGTERRDLRVVGEVSAADFLGHLNQVGTP